MWGSPDLTKLDRMRAAGFIPAVRQRAYQIEIEKPGVRVSHLTAGFFYCAEQERPAPPRPAVQI
jgi:hypothetical protein